jgi:hypothetical protein
MALRDTLNAIKGLIFQFNSDAQNDADFQDGIADLFFTAPIVVDSAAGTDFTYWSLKAPCDLRIVEVTVCPGAALTASDTITNTYTLAKADGAGGAATAIAALATTVANTNWAADVFKTVPITQSASTVLKGQILTLKKTHLSTGTVTPASTFYIRARRGN